MSKLVKVSLACIITGCIILAGMLPYYYFEWGVPPCQGLPADPANCGDGDFGGVWFVLIGLPFVGAGLLGLAYAALRALLRRHGR